MGLAIEERRLTHRDAGSMGGSVPGTTQGDGFWTQELLSVPLTVKLSSTSQPARVVLLPVLIFLEFVP